MVLLSPDETKTILDNLCPKQPKATSRLCCNEIYKRLYDLSSLNKSRRQKYAWITIAEYDDGTSEQVRLPFKEAEKHLLKGCNGTTIEDFDSSSFFTRPYKTRMLPSGKIKTINHERVEKGYRDRIIEIRHLITVDSVYVGTEVYYSLQKRQFEYHEDGSIRASYYREYDTRKEYVNIFDSDKDLDEFYLKMRKSFKNKCENKCENKDKFIKINNYYASVAYGRYQEINNERVVSDQNKKTSHRLIDRPAYSVAANDRELKFAHAINSNTEEIHLSHTPELSIPYRMDKGHSAIDFDASMFPSHPIWTEKIHRPVWYIGGCDYSSPSFDCNTFFFYLDKERLCSILQRSITSANQSLNRSNAQKYADSFIKALIDSAFALYYINLSNGWDINDLSFDTIWNLMNYILFMIKPFGRSNVEQSKNWIKYVTVDWMIYKAKKRYATLTHSPVVICFEKLAKKFSSDYNQCLKPKEMPYDEFRAWKQHIGVPKKKQDITKRKKQTKAVRKGANTRMARNAQIYSLHKEGKSYGEISNCLGINYKTVWRIVNSGQTPDSSQESKILIDDSIETRLSVYLEKRLKMNDLKEKNPAVKDAVF